jgi:Fe-S-cluster containining protein
MNREERRRTQNQALRDYREWGLPPRFDFPAMFAHTRALLRSLGKRPDAARLMQATRAYHAGFERSLLSFPPPETTACRAGCSMCCHNWISVTLPEVLLIADWLRANQKTVSHERIVAAAETGMNRNRDERLALRLACPLLAEGLCSVYGVRPLACRAFFSLSLQACRDVFDGLGEDVPTARDAMVLRGVHDRCFWSALRAAGLPSDAYELNHALALALSHDDPAGIWLRGGDVFAVATPDIAHDEEELLFLDVLIAGARERKLPANPWVD